ncbi:MAG: C-terminal binding protein [Spirochaetales bacterium]|nr:C-terminal binding protein [Spirochaetales bacterium]
MADFKVVILDNRYADYKQEQDVLSQIGVEPEIHFPANNRDAILLLKEADGVICNLFNLTSEIITEMDKCRVISRYGVGYDNVDVAAASLKGITVCNVPDYATEDASDHALALLLNCVRKISYRDRKVREGLWNLHSHHPCFRLSGKVMGIVGFGHIGKCLIRKLSGLGFSRIIVFDPMADEKQISLYGSEKVSFDELLSESDCISIHCPLNSDTTKMFDSAAFSKMKKSSILINTARGAIIDEAALCQALANKQLSAAGLDVYEKEPVPMDSPLRCYENITLSDHAAWYSEESLVELKTKAALNVLKVLSGMKSEYSIN